MLPNTLKPGDGNMDTEAIGSVDLANSTLETFVQGQRHQLLQLPQHERRLRLPRQGHQHQPHHSQRAAEYPAEKPAADEPRLSGQ